MSAIIIVAASIVVVLQQLLNLVLVLEAKAGESGINMLYSLIDVERDAQCNRALTMSLAEKTVNSEPPTGPIFESSYHSSFLFATL